MPQAYILMHVVVNGHLGSPSSLDAAVTFCRRNLTRLFAIINHYFGPGNAAVYTSTIWENNPFLYLSITRDGLQYNWSLERSDGLSCDIQITYFVFFLFEANNEIIEVQLTSHKEFVFFLFLIYVFIYTRHHDLLYTVWGQM